MAMITGTLNALFGRKKRSQVQKTSPEVYFKHVYLTKQNFEGVEFIAKTARTSLVRMTNELIERGIRSFYGEAIGEVITDNIDKKTHNKRISMFLWHLRRYAREQGTDISKLL